MLKFGFAGMPMFKKVLIANRGEIAVRIIRACRELGIIPVAVYSDVDRASVHVRLADEAYPIGPAPSTESYLVIEKILGAARYASCDAIHPGYGFLAENPALARACRDSKIAFIGPSAEAMEQLGSKTAARHTARDIGTPTVAGTLDPIKDISELAEIARKIGLPIVLKAVAGGGGKGMRVVEHEHDLKSAWRDAASEAQNAFGDERVYVEKYLERPRHIEMQILADHHGHIVYLGERECSVQRRHQKVIEEAPSAIMTADLRQAMGEAAVKLARAGNYTNAGTVEFLVDADRKFYFLEMNTRLQVEHPVTEMVTSQDLVKLQMRIAADEKLPFTQKEVEIRGHAIECRIYAEDPDNNFFPSPGKILDRMVPGGPGIRSDDGVYAGWTVPNEYDPMLGKLIAWGRDRQEAIARLQRALGEYHASGIKTNISLFRRILASANFQKAAIYTRWLDDFLQPGNEDSVRETARDLPDEERFEEAVLIATALWHKSHRTEPNSESSGVAQSVDSRWRTEARREQMNGEPER
jgi:acetyl-CoA carboxylase biotin carboxylase subunit